MARDTSQQGLISHTAILNRLVPRDAQRGKEQEDKDKRIGGPKKGRAVLPN